MNIFFDVSGAENSVMGVIMAPPYPVVFPGQTTEPLQVGGEYGGKRKWLKYWWRLRRWCCLGFEKVEVKRRYRAEMELVSTLVDLSRDSLVWDWWWTTVYYRADCSKCLTSSVLSTCWPISQLIDVHCWTCLKDTLGTLSSGCFPRVMRWQVGALGGEETSKIQSMTQTVEHRSVAIILLDKESWRALNQALEHNQMGALERVDIVVESMITIGRRCKG